MDTLWGCHSLHDIKAKSIEIIRAHNNIRIYVVMAENASVWRNLYFWHFLKLNICAWWNMFSVNCLSYNNITQENFPIATGVTMPTYWLSP